MYVVFWPRMCNLILVMRKYHKNTLLNVLLTKRKGWEYILPNVKATKGKNAVEMSLNKGH